MYFMMRRSGATPLRCSAISGSCCRLRVGCADREDIASEGIYEFLTPKTVLVLRLAWRAMTFVFGGSCSGSASMPRSMFLANTGSSADCPKRAPMMVLPICGVLIALVTAFTLAEDLFGWRAVEDFQP